MLNSRSSCMSSLEQRLAVERELGDARRTVEDAEAFVREQDGVRLKAEAVAESARSALAEISLGMQETRVRRESLAEQFAATQFDLEQVTIALPGRDRRRLGPAAGVSLRADRAAWRGQSGVNRRAQGADRTQEYLDRQFADLSDALNTLEQAIRKIDRETRALPGLRSTASTADSRTSFRGSSAAVRPIWSWSGMTCSPLASRVMARPPGKRNSTIHQLSGGEKALTAVALVFSIFRAEPGAVLLAG